MSKNETDWHARMEGILAKAGTHADASFESPSGKHYVRERERTNILLERAFESTPARVLEFFKRFSHVRPHDLERISSFIRDTRRDEEMQNAKAPIPKAKVFASDALASYVEFVLRFGVRFKFHSTATHFREENLALIARKFHGRILKGQLVPVMTSDHDEEAEFHNFISDALELPERLENEFNTVPVRWFRIDDPRGNSLLSQIEEVSYSVDQITFIHHNSARNVLYCIIGENTSDDTWKAAGKIRAKFQQETYGTATRGRKPNTIKRAEQYEALRSTESMDTIAAGLSNKGTEPDVNAIERDLRRRKGELRGLKK